MPGTRVQKCHTRQTICTQTIQHFQLCYLCSVRSLLIIHYVLTQCSIKFLPTARLYFVYSFLHLFSLQARSVPLHSVPDTMLTFILSFYIGVYAGTQTYSIQYLTCLMVSRSTMDTQWGHIRLLQHAVPTRLPPYSIDEAAIQCLQHSVWVALCTYYPQCLVCQ